MTSVIEPRMKVELNSWVLLKLLKYSHCLKKLASSYRPMNHYILSGNPFLSPGLEARASKLIRALAPVRQQSSFLFSFLRRKRFNSRLCLIFCGKCCFVSKWRLRKNFNFLSDRIVASGHSTNIKNWHFIIITQVLLIQITPGAGCKLRFIGLWSLIFILVVNLKYGLFSVQAVAFLIHLG